MKAWLLDQIGSLDDLRLGEAPDPIPGPGEALLQVEFAALNPADRYLAEGEYPAKPALPHILGRDGIGTVVALGPALNDDGGADSIKVGDRRVLLRSEIGVNRPGTFAELVAIPVESLVLPPANWSAEQSAAAPLVYLTAYQALTFWGDLSPGVVLITGASGGVGVASLQLARAMGHMVIGMSRDAGKSEKLRAMGAQLVVDPNDATWRAKVKEFLGKRRVDLAIDNIGGALFSQVLDTLGRHGRISCVGRLAGPVPEFNTASLFFRRLRIGGIHVGSYTPPESRAAWERVLQLLGEAGATPEVDSVWAFEELKQAFERLAAGPMAKVVLQIKRASRFSG
jgi:NADPH2:quinone reductase